MSTLAQQLADMIPGWDVAVEVDQVLRVQMRRKCMVCMQMHQIKAQLDRPGEEMNFAYQLRGAARWHDSHGVAG